MTTPSPESKPALTPLPPDIEGLVRRIMEGVNLIEGFHGQKLNLATNAMIATNERYKSRAELEAEIRAALLSLQAQAMAARRALDLFRYANSLVSSDSWDWTPETRAKFAQAESHARVLYGELTTNEIALIGQSLLSDEEPAKP